MIIEQEPVLTDSPCFDRCQLKYIIIEIMIFKLILKYFNRHSMLRSMSFAMAGCEDFHNEIKKELVHYCENRGDARYCPNRLFSKFYAVLFL